MNLSTRAKDYFRPRLKGTNMAKQSKRISLLIILIPILLLLGFGAYFSFFTIEKYVHDNELRKNLKLASKLSSLEQYVADEVACVAGASTKENNIEELCHDQRKKTDEFLTTFTNVSSGDKLLDPFIEFLYPDINTHVLKINDSINTLRTQLKNIRYDIDVASDIDIKTLLYGEYYQMYLSLLMKAYKYSLAQILPAIPIYEFTMKLKM